MVGFPDARLPAQSVAPADHTHARAQPGSVGTNAIDDNAVTYAKVDESTFPATTTAAVATQETTTSTSYTDLTTAGPAITMTPPASGKVKVHLYAQLWHGDAAQAAHMSVALSGGNTVAAADSRSIKGFGLGGRVGATFLVTGLSVASTTFTTKYRATSGVDTARFLDRQIIVEPVLA